MGRPRRRHRPRGGRRPRRPDRRIERQQHDHLAERQRIPVLWSTEHDDLPERPEPEDDDAHPGHGRVRAGVWRRQCRRDRPAGGFAESHQVDLRLDDHGVRQRALRPVPRPADLQLPSFFRRHLLEGLRHGRPDDPLWLRHDPGHVAQPGRHPSAEERQQLRLGCRHGQYRRPLGERLYRQAQLGHDPERALGRPARRARHARRRTGQPHHRLRLSGRQHARTPVHRRHGHDPGGHQRPFAPAHHEAAAHDHDGLGQQDLRRCVYRLPVRQYLGLRRGDPGRRGRLQVGERRHPARHLGCVHREQQRRRRRRQRGCLPHRPERLGRHRRVRCGRLQHGQLQRHLRQRHPDREQGVGDPFAQEQLGQRQRHAA